MVVSDGFGGVAKFDLNSSHALLLQDGKYAIRKHKVSMNCNQRANAEVCLVAALLVTQQESEYAR